MILPCFCRKSAQIGGIFGYPSLRSASVLQMTDRILQDIDRGTCGKNASVKGEIKRITHIIDFSRIIVFFHYGPAFQGFEKRPVAGSAFFLPVEYVKQRHFILCRIMKRSHHLLFRLLQWRVFCEKLRSALKMQDHYGITRHCPVQCHICQGKILLFLFTFRGKEIEKSEYDYAQQHQRA